MKFAFVFFDKAKFADFGKKMWILAELKGVCHVIFIFSGFFLDKA